MQILSPNQGDDGNYFLIHQKRINSFDDLGLKPVIALTEF